MGGFELIIFGVGPTFGLVISLLAWLCEGQYSKNDEGQHHYWSNL